MGSKPKAPKASAEEKAIIIRQSAELDKTMAENEKRLKAITRGKLGSKSLLGTAADAAKKEVGAGSYSPDRSHYSGKARLKVFAWHCGRCSKKRSWGWFLQSR
jgi:hypothetical protein